MQSFYLFVLGFFFIMVITGPAAAQTNCTPAPTAPLLDCASALTDVCEGDAALVTALTTTTELPTLEYLITRVGALASDGLGDEILGSTMSAIINPASYGLLPGEQFDITPAAYDLAQVQALINDIYTNTFFGVPCCTWVDVASPGFCVNLMAGGITSGSNIQDLNDMLQLFSVLTGVPSTTSSVAGFLASVDNINTQASSLPAACGGSNIPICYAVGQGTGVCRYTILPGTAPACNTSLPLELSSFYGEAMRLHNDLKWITQTETNTAYFSMERSNDGINFTEIGRVEAAGNSNTSTDYSFEDNNPFTKLNYYRLALVGLDEQISYSEILLVQRDDPEGFEVIAIGPIPNRESLTVGIASALQESIVLRIIDISGRLHKQVSLTVSEGLNTYQIKTAQLTDGMYILTIIRPDSGIELHAKFIKHFH